MCSLPGNQDRPHREKKSASRRLGSRLHIWVSKPLLEKYLGTPLATLVGTYEKENRGGEETWGGNQNKGKACCIFRPPCAFFAFTDLAIATLIPKKYNTGNDKTLQKKCVEPHKQSTF